jgi:hypothetical protein
VDGQEISDATLQSVMLRQKGDKRLVLPHVLDRGAGESGLSTADKKHECGPMATGIGATGGSVVSLERN